MGEGIAITGMEYRTFPFEVRADGDDEGRIKGHAAVFNKLSVDLGGFREQIAPGAFKKTLREADVVALFNHDTNYVLGRKRSKTLGLEEDDEGLAVDIKVPDTTWANDLTVSMKRGDIDQMSFAFQTVKDRWEQNADGQLIRTLLEVKLFDVSVVTFPAYPQTSAQARGEAIAGFDQYGQPLFRGPFWVPVVNATGTDMRTTEPVQQDHSDDNPPAEEPVQQDHSIVMAARRRWLDVMAAV